MDQDQGFVSDFQYSYCSQRQQDERNQHHEQMQVENSQQMQVENQQENFQNSEAPDNLMNQLKNDPHVKKTRQLINNITSEFYQYVIDKGDKEIVAKLYELFGKKQSKNYITGLKKFKDLVTLEENQKLKPYWKEFLLDKAYQINQENPKTEENEEMLASLQEMIKENYDSFLSYRYLYSNIKLSKPKKIYQNIQKQIDLCQKQKMKDLYKIKTIFPKISDMFNYIEKCLKDNPISEQDNELIEQFKKIQELLGEDQQSIDEMIRNGII